MVRRDTQSIVPRIGDVLWWQGEVCQVIDTRGTRGYFDGATECVFPASVLLCRAAGRDALWSGLSPYEFGEFLFNLFDLNQEQPLALLSRFARLVRKAVRGKRAPAASGEVAEQVGRWAQ